jgi:hypothetical protein
MLLVESGPERVGEWVIETRNVYEDYQRIFGEPPGRITAVGIITDTDATGAKVEAYYGDIALLPARPASGEGGEVTSTSVTAGSPGDRPGLDCPTQEK